MTNEKQLKTYCIASQTNYDLMVHIVNAYTEEEALKIALENGAWEGCIAEEIDTQTYGFVLSPR